MLSCCLCVDGHQKTAHCREFGLGLRFRSASDGLQKLLNPPLVPRGMVPRNGRIAVRDSETKTAIEPVDVLVSVLVSCCELTVH